MVLLHVTEWDHKSKVHVQLPMAVEQRDAGVVRQGVVNRLTEHQGMCGERLRLRQQVLPRNKNQEKAE